MNAWKQTLLAIIRETHLLLDGCFYWLRRLLRIGQQAPITVFTYRGFGGKDFIFLQGRVLKKRLFLNNTSNSDWIDLINNFRRLWSVEIRNAVVEINIGENFFQLRTDKEGFFKLDAKLELPWLNSIKGWNSVPVKLVSVPWKTINADFKSEVYIPSHPEFAFISDIDDTIIHTEVTSLLKWKMFYLTFLKNARKRMAIKEVGAFYQALNHGKKALPENPVFYVSKSPWNLYDLLEDFLQLNHLPLGPLLLRDYGLPYQKYPKNYKGHKVEHITKILKSYPDIPFILIGDSGESDIKIYLSIAKRFPQQIMGIYIRDVNHFRKAKKIQKIISKNQFVETTLVPDFRSAAIHAANKGWISYDFFLKWTE